jgi:transposase-like protein
LCVRKNEKVEAKVASPAETPPENVRGRPGRRSAEDRRRAVLELLGGKATVDQIAMRFGVLPQTVEGWRDDALAGIDAALKQGTGKSARELELEAEVEVLRETALNATMQVTLLQKAMGIKPRPSRPARSRR